MDNIYTIIDSLNKVSATPVMEDDKAKMNKGIEALQQQMATSENKKEDPMKDSPFSSDSVSKLLDAEQQIAGIKTQLKDAIMQRLAELAGVPLAEIEETVNQTPEDMAAKIKEGHCEACGCEMANPDPACECGAPTGKVVLAMGEDEVEEGNEFSGALAQAKKDGKEEFEVDGKTYKVEEAESDAEEDDHAEKAGKEVAKDIEHDEGHKGADDAKAEKAGAKVTKDIEYDDAKDRTDEEFEDEDVCEKCDEKKADCKCEKVDETTVSGAVAVAADGAGLYKNASVYESNEIVRAASKLMESMSVNVSVGDDGRRSINVNATDDDAVKLASLLKLAGVGAHMSDMNEGEQEFANGADATAEEDTEYMTQDIAGGLNGPKRQVNPNNPADNPLAMKDIKNQTLNQVQELDEAEVADIAATRLMELYQEYKAK